MRTTTPFEQLSPDIDQRWIALFEDRYGEGTYARLLDQFRKPCVTFAAIATQFGVTRENVRQWHRRLLPDAPRGHERQRLCRLYQQKRQVLTDDLFAGFYRRIRAAFPGQRVRLIPSRGGFLKRYLHVDGHLVALKRARSTGDAYVLGSGGTRADFIYFELTATDYLFVPRAVVPTGTTTFHDTLRSKYQPFKNSFAPLLTHVREERVS